MENGLTDIKIKKRVFLYKKVSSLFEKISINLNVEKIKKQKTIIGKERYV